MDAEAAKHQQHLLDCSEYAAWQLSTPSGIALDPQNAWMGGMQYGRRTPRGTLLNAPRQQSYTLLDGLDHELQTLHLIIEVIEHWLPIKKLDGALPEQAAANSVARARVARYLLERFQQEHPF